jgi:hypothetical protein
VATFLHITDARDIARIRKSGLRPSRGYLHRAVFCVPVVPDPQATFQWVRELKVRGYRTACGVQFRIADTEHVMVGRFQTPHHWMTAAAAVSFFLHAADPRGLEVLVPRAVRPKEIVRIRALPQVAGWRFFPEAKGRLPFCAIPGSIKAARLRHRLEHWATSSDR